MIMKRLIWLWLEICKMNKKLEIVLLVCLCSFLEYVHDGLGVFILVVSLGAWGIRTKIIKKNLKDLEEVKKSKSKNGNGKG